MDSDPIFDVDLDEEEQELLDAFERGEFKPLKDSKKEMKMLTNAAENYFLKDQRINVRISSADLNMIKRLAVQEGLPYQTFVTSILHKLVTGRLIPQRIQNQQNW